LADYRDNYSEILATGASVAAISVDVQKKSAALRRQLDLPFPILCDTDRRVIQEWDIYNSREKGGIAKPASFVVERDRTVRYATVDSVARRVPATEMLMVLQSIREGQQVRRKTYVPRLVEWFRAIRNMIRR
jgi:peroxiredoxin